VPGQPSKLSLISDKQTLKADNVDETGFTVYLRDYNDNLITAEIRDIYLETRYNNAVVMSTTVTTLNGQVAGIKIRSGTQTGTITVTAVSYGLTGVSQAISVVPTIVKRLAINRDYNPILSADGVSSATIKFELLDTNGNKVTAPDYPVTITAYGSYGTIGLPNRTVTETQISTYTINGETTIVLKSAIKSGVIRLTAESAGLENCTLNIGILPQSPAKVNLTADQPKLTANGSNETIVRASVMDINNNVITEGVSGLTFALASVQSAGTFSDNTVLSRYVETVDGVATVKIKSTTRTGTIRVTVSVANISPGNIEITSVADTATRLVLNLGSTQMKADGVSKTTVTIEVLDQYNNRVVDFQEEAVLTTIGPVQETIKYGTLVNGTTTFMLTSINKAGTVRIKVTSMSLGTTENVLVTVSDVASKISLIASNSILTADGIATTPLQAKLLDSNDNQVFTGTNTVKFTISGNGTWLDGTVNSQLSTVNSGVATISLRSTITAGIIRITGALLDLYSGVELDSATIELNTVADEKPNKIILGLRQGSNSSIPADGISETVLESVITDINGNIIKSANNRVTYTIEGMGNIVDSTGTVKTIIVDAQSGISQVKVRSTIKSGEIPVIAESVGLTGSSATVITIPGYASKIDWLTQSTIMPADGKSKIKLSAVIKDSNDNIVTDYPDPVLFSLSGVAAIETSTTVYPAGNGIVDVIIKAGVKVSTITVTAKTRVLSSSQKIFAVISKLSKVGLDINPAYIYSSRKSSITVSLMDEFNNLVPVDNPVRVTLTAESGEFSVVIGTDNKVKTGFTPFSFNMTKPQEQVIYTGMKSGDIRIDCESDGLQSGNRTIAVFNSTSVMSVKVETSTTVFVPSNLTFVLHAVDNNDNPVSDTNFGVDLVGENSNTGEQIIATGIYLNDGSAKCSVIIKESGIYEFTTSTGNLRPRTVQVFCVVKKDSYSILQSKTDIGDIKLAILPNTLTENLIIEMKKTGAATVELVPKDAQGYPYLGEAIQADKFMELTFPYPDQNRDGIVDGTDYAAENLRVFYQSGDKWVVQKKVEYKTINLQAGIFNLDNSIINKNLNTVTVRINKFGTYKVMGITTEPTIENVVVYPNPFSNDTKLTFDMGSEGNVKVDVYTVAGRLIKTLVKQVTVNDVGNIELEYDGTDNNGQQIANSTYLYKITTKNTEREYVKTGKFTRMK
jgi:hypothetical protein